MEKQLNIAFDVDDTLIIPGVATGGRETPNYEVIETFRFFEAQGHKMFIWSGSGIDWATTWAEKLGLKAIIIPKHNPDKIPMDLAFDDCDVELAKVNIKVKRINNHISRKEWNETKKNPTEN